MAYRVRLLFACLMVSFFIAAPTASVNASNDVVPRKLQVNYQPSLFGVHEQLLRENTENSRNVTINIHNMAKMGVRHHREAIFVSTLMQNCTNFYADKKAIEDYVLTEDASHGIEVLGCWSDLPFWLTGLSGWGATPWRDTTPGSKYMGFISNYTKMWKTLVHAFPQIMKWEVGNELNHDPFMHPPEYPMMNFTYAQKISIMCDLAYYGTMAIHQENPSAISVFNGLAPVNLTKAVVISGIRDYMALIYENIKSGLYPCPPAAPSTKTDDYFQMAAWHPYLWSAGPNTTNWVIPNNEIHDVMVSNGDGSKHVLFTEFGYTQWAGNPAENQIGQWHMDAFMLAGTNFPWLDTIYVHQLVDNVEATEEGENHYGFLLSPAGSYAWKTRAYSYQSCSLDANDFNAYCSQWNFDAWNSPEGWTSSAGMTAPIVGAGFLNTSKTSDAAWLLGPSGQSINADIYKHIWIRMRASAGTQAALYFTRSDDTAWDESKSLWFTVQPGWNNTGTEFVTYILDMSAKASWHGTVTQLRLDPIKISPATGNVQIDYIRVGAPAPVPEIAGLPILIAVIAICFSAGLLKAIPRRGE